MGASLLIWIAGLSFGGFGLVGVAYWIFQQWGTKWLDNRFARNLEAAKHEHQAELQRLKQKIDAHLDRAIKLHNKEFEVLPEVWRLMDLAFARIEALSMRLFRGADLNSLSDEMLDMFLKGSGLPEIQQAEIKAASDKTNLYIRALQSRDLGGAQNARIEFYNYLIGNGVFLQTEFFDKFVELDGLMLSAFVEQQMAYDGRGQGVSVDYKAFLALTEDGKKKKDGLLKAIRARVWSSASHVLPEAAM